jgi:hypothetical protein
MIASLISAAKEAGEIGRRTAIVYSPHRKKEVMAISARKHWEGYMDE